jgi:cell fate regulator YaaT (PSP1 superfamily)
MNSNVLVRYGTVSEVARFSRATDAALERGRRVVVRSHRGVEIGTLLEDLVPQSDHAVNGCVKGGDGHDDNTVEPTSLCILRTATREDEQIASRLKDECEKEFQIWRRRIDEWKLDLELIDLEWTLDKSKLILYVLNDRGPECTKLALQAAAAGLGTVEVQPVGPDGPVTPSREGGCGSGHCGSGGDSHGGCCG